MRSGFAGRSGTSAHSLKIMPFAFQLSRFGNKRHVSSEPLAESIAVARMGAAKICLMIYPKECIYRQTNSPAFTSLHFRPRQANSERTTDYIGYGSVFSLVAVGPEEGIEPKAKGFPGRWPGLRNGRPFAFPP